MIYPCVLHAQQHNFSLLNRPNNASVNCCKLHSRVLLNEVCKSVANLGDGRLTQFALHHSSETTRKNCGIRAVTSIADAGIGNTCGRVYTKMSFSSSTESTCRRNRCKKALYKTIHSLLSKSLLFSSRSQHCHCGVCPCILQGYPCDVKLVAQVQTA